jgi:hypothetical protein
MMMSDEFVKRWVVSCALAAAVAPVPAFAQIAPKPAAAAEPVGRLFYTPAQRASLDIARTQRARNTLVGERTVDETTPVAQTVTYGGVVRRGDGKSTVWLNGRPVNDNDPVGGVSLVGRVSPDGSVTLQVPQSGRSVNLKPGQSIELLSGTVEEGYSRRPIETEPKPAAKPAAGATKPAPKPASADRTAEDRDREEREQQRVEEAVSRALQETARPQPGAAPGPAPAAKR